MKKIILLALSAASLSAYGLPTYEPFTEFGPTLVSSAITLVVKTNGVSMGTNADSYITNCLDLATGGYQAPSTESWGALLFSGTMPSGTKGVNITNGLDIAVISNSTIFTYSLVSGLLPSTFPGFPPSNGYITNMVENPAQPRVWNGSVYTVTNIMGNSAVLKFASDITRPISGTKTLFVSYLFSLAQQGQMATGNNGRYLAFLASSNLSEGWTGTGPVAGAFYTNWGSMFNSFNIPGGTNRYPCHGLLSATAGSTYYIGACDSSTGKNWSSTANVGSYNTPIFVVGEYVLGSGGTNSSVMDTNIVWMNPSPGSFGGATPPASGNHVLTMGFNMNDLGGLAFIDRSGNLASGGVGTNYIANLIIGSTWSYVTGGPEFTNQPPALTSVPLNGTASISGQATAAGQTVSYQWYNVTSGSNLVNGANSSTLTIPNFGPGNVGYYVLVATALGTGLALASTPAELVLADPEVTTNPANTTANYGGSASFTAIATTATPPLKYGWWFNGALVSSGTASGSSPYTLTLTLNNVSYQNGGSYTLYVTNGSGFNNNAAPSSATLTVNDPIITVQPTNPAAAAGGPAYFYVTAAGSPTLNYAWYKGATQLVSGTQTASGATITIDPVLGTLSLGGSGVQDADNGSYYCAVTGSASLQTTNSATVTLTVQDALAIATSVSPAALAERVGDHLAFTISVTGGGPSFQWYGPNGSPIAGATTSALVLTNITTASGGSYSVVVSNLLTPAVTKSATLTVINSAILPLATTNLVVARVGDGAQTLSSATGNTLYLDQYKTNGTYVNTIQVPDEAVGSPYGTGSASSANMPFGSPALLVQGAGGDAEHEPMLTLSGVNQEYLCFAGYCEAYPFAGPDVTVGGSAYPDPYPRGLATIDAFGIYSLAYTNGGLYSGGNHTLCSMVTLDGTNFWTTGQAGSGTVKYVNGGSAGVSYANGSGIPGSSGVSAGGGRSIQIVNGPLSALAGSSSVNNLVCTDAGEGANSGLYAASGTPEPLPTLNIAFTPLLYTGGGLPADFAFSPDNATIYVAEAGLWTGAGPGAGGIERWDTNTTGTAGWLYSYTLPVLPGGTATNGAQGLTVDFSASPTWGTNVNGAIIYATSTGAAGNSLVKVVDNGNPTNAAPTVTVLATAGAQQALRGVRFGPAAIAPSFAAALQTQSTDLGNSATFAVTANGSAPLFYQWYFDGKAIAGATQASFTTNNLSYASEGTYSVVVSNLTGQTATNSAVLDVTAGSPTITPTPLPNYTETAGDHLAWGPTVTGTLPITNYWYCGNTLVQSNVTPPANGSLALTNIQTTNDGTYTLVVSNFYGHASAAGTLTVTTTPQMLYPTNLVVARVGDGAQTLSGTNGNTLYLDQYTTNNGMLVSTIQIPDEGTGQPYYTGGADSASMPFGSPALLFAGSNVAPGNDAGYEAFLSLAPNGETLTFAGYCQAYPFAGPDVSIGAQNGNQWRGIGAVDAYGFYTLTWTNTGLYSGGNHQIHAALDIDGNGTNYYTTGEAGSGPGVRYCTTSFEPASGIGLVEVAGSYSGTRVAQVLAGNLVFSDAGATTNGIYACVGLPVATATAGLMIAETNSPMDFAASPDLQTVYIADNGTFGGTNVQAGGIQRWDANGTSAYGYPTYAYSYTLGTGTNSTVGARGLTVDFSANPTWGATAIGAKLYVTTAEPSGNRLIKITDTGAASSATLLSLAGPSQMLAGVRFGPAVVLPNFATQPQNEGGFAGSAATFSANALGSGPLTYQWYFQANCGGAFNPILNATNTTYTFNAAGANVGCYYVVVTNPGSKTAQSDTVSFTLLSPPYFLPSTYPGPYGGIELNFIGPAGVAYRIWTTTDVTLSPIESTWTELTGANFSGGIDSVTDQNGGSNPQQFYIISVP